MNRLKYASLAGLAAVAVLTGPAVAAAAGDPPPSDTAPQAPAAEAAAPRPALTAKASVASSVRAWQQFHINGVSHHMATGTRVTLQEKQGERWVSLPATVNIKHDATYSMPVKLGLKGHNALRIVGGGAVSPVLHVTVR
ncbi:hypothetical protein AB0H77_41810 [Streptomyces sp. NPDC050844]|uniref:hypothetical protein n=1 Tax=Streptomyces sp. NPDC050844 TaxID=3155790 RepID=UPI0033C2BAA1